MLLGMSNFQQRKKQFTVLNFRDHQILPSHLKNDLLRPLNFKTICFTSCLPWRICAQGHLIVTCKNECFYNPCIKDYIP